MTSVVSYLKGVRTRFRNSLKTEMQVGRGILNLEFPPIKQQDYVLKSSRCIEKLKSKLNGDAKHAISGLSLSNKNYDIAVGILKDRFGNVQDVVDLHYNEMINLQPATNKTSSLTSFLDKVKKRLRSLDVLKQDVNQDIFVSMVKSKLPEQVLLQLEIQKGATKNGRLKYYVKDYEIML
ncbi:unnamed protein product [Mytilus coruscus]|uniref:Uncharacterized protein n=1 Tax=Mytilus coruscus TaxID=42192 RepID=A0A6J8A332_MYTCO|nr:unnamed protein product [Mytilus coruscus]